MTTRLRNDQHHWRLSNADSSSRAFLDDHNIISNRRHYNYSRPVRVKIFCNGDRFFQGKPVNIATNRLSVFYNFFTRHITLDFE